MVHNMLGRVFLIKSSGPEVDTSAARLPDANQLFRIGSSGIKS